MSTPRDEGRTAETSPAHQAEALRQQFETAWQEALAGALPPLIDTYLALAPEADRTALAEDFRRIERDYREHQGPAGGRTTEVIAPAGPSGADATIPNSPGPLPALSLGPTQEIAPRQPDQTVPSATAEVPGMSVTVAVAPSGGSSRAPGRRPWRAPRRP